MKDTKKITYNENAPRSNVQKTSKIKNTDLRTLGGSISHRYIYKQLKYILNFHNLHYNCYLIILCNFTISEYNDKIH